MTATIGPVHLIQRCPCCGGRVVALVAAGEADDLERQALAERRALIRHLLRECGPGEWSLL